jgi:hypothetical protein
MGTAQVVFAVERCGGATGSYVTGSDVSHMTGSDDSDCPEVCSAHAQPKLRNIRPSGVFLTGSDKVTWSERALSRSGPDRE